MAIRSRDRSKKPGTPRLPIRKLSIRNVQPQTGPVHTGAVASIQASSPATKASAVAPTLPNSEASPLLDLRKVKTISVKEAAYRSMKSEDTIYRWLRRGRLSGWQLGGPGCNVLVSEQSLEEILSRSTQFRA
ncbi:MAG: hypothetical protein HYX72_02925 [Acidobacteria bacterium]|nr:hypothetical protein [Acidobacteriota bacterium]